jgi:hypothetical protein
MLWDVPVNDVWEATIYGTNLAPGVQLLLSFSPPLTPERWGPVSFTNQPLVSVLPHLCQLEVRV